MPPRAGSRADVLQFSKRTFGASRGGASSSATGALPGFVASRPSLVAAALGSPSAGDRPQRSREMTYACLGARTLPQRPRGPPRPPARDGESSEQGPAQRTGPDAARKDRSRSPASRRRHAALPGLRRDGPGRLGGQLVPQSLETAADRAKALEDLTEGFYATSSGSAVRARRSCYVLQRVILIQRGGSDRRPQQRGAGVRASCAGCLDGGTAGPC